MDIISERAIAISGMLQACKEVQSLARTGEMDLGAYESSLKSILVLDAVNTPAIYGGIEGVKKGLGLLSGGIMNSTAEHDVEILRYVMSLLQLQSQLYRNSEKFASFASEVERLSSKSTNDLPQACSDIYQKYVSGMQPQVIVQGEEAHLQRAEIPPQIRALLLAALRSAVLWQQKGGGRFRLIWERTRMQNAAKQILKNTH